GFTGKEDDVEVGLTYFGRRFLSTRLNRWVSADPLAVHVPGEADLNLYGYVTSQVLRNIDPLGLEKEAAEARSQQEADEMVAAYNTTQNRFADDTAKEAQRNVEQQERDALYTQYSHARAKDSEIKATERSSATAERDKWERAQAEWSEKPPLWKGLHSVGLGSLDTEENQQALSIAAGRVGAGKGGGAGRTQPSKAPSARLQYLGRTPGKSSRTGLEVQARMASEGRVRGQGAQTEVQDQAGKWHPITEMDMGHTTDAVKWWNSIGIKHGPRSAEVRKWMLDPRNYELQHRSANRAAGAKLRDRYRAPDTE
ncbi:MAG TPA: RHS repeat-associated core domain-containing protein, partial [Polyangiaceae bacterium]|nr:RHS repeat-associated core domain-containing protein [Polyangiaceae bacterium]